ncbi:MAG: hypothetical protein J1G38_04130 [Clostridiales bacterium]|nr:hypothetical protein [Clostridiales bacterium]
MSEKATVKFEEYAVCELTAAGLAPDTVYKNDVEFDLPEPTIIELAAVKVCGDEIVGSFHTFVQIDGIDAARELDFDESPTLRGVTPKMLVGAPSLGEALNRFNEFTKGCTLILRNDWDNRLKVLRDCGARFGLRFERVIDLCNIVAAADALRRYFETRTPDLLDIAAAMCDSCEWKELFAWYEVPFGREDCLGYALAFAELIIKLTDEFDLPF